MSWANNQGIRIHYQVVGDGPPLILQHGFSGSLRLWYDLGYVERLSKDYRLILVDARGHGGSDKPHESEAYRLERLVSDITAVLDDLRIAKAHYWGYSWGGWIGFGMAKYAAQRLESLIIGGTHPYGRRAQARELFRNGIDEWIQFLADEGNFPEAALARAQKNDVKALLAVIQDRADMSDILPSVTLPSLLYVGSMDSEYELMKKCAQELSRATLVTLSDLGHLQAMARSDLVIPHAVRFLESL